jgi:hypothetical protein
MSQSCIPKKSNRKPYKCSVNTKFQNCGTTHQKPPKKHICSMRHDGKCMITDTGIRLNNIMDRADNSSINTILEQIDSLQRMDDDDVERVILQLEDIIRPHNSPQPIISTSPPSSPRNVPRNVPQNRQCGQHGRVCKYSVNRVSNKTQCKVGDDDGNGPDNRCICRPPGPKGHRQCRKKDTIELQGTNNPDIDSITVGQLRGIIDNIDGANELIRQLEQLYNQHLTVGTQVPVVEVPIGSSDILDNTKQIFINGLNVNELRTYLRHFNLPSFGSVSVMKQKLSNYFKTHPEENPNNDIIKDVKSPEDLAKEEVAAKGGGTKNNYLEYESESSDSDLDLSSDLFTDEINYDSDNTLLLSDMDNSFLKYDINNNYNTDTYPTSTIGTLTLNLDNLSSTT